MDVFTTKKLEVDLSLWRSHKSVVFVVPTVVTVGHAADELARFVGLPTHSESGDAVVYSLIVGQDDDAAEIDRALTVAALGNASKVALNTESDVPYLEELLTDYQKKFKDALDEEVELWIAKGRQLVHGALTDATNEINGQLRKRIAPLVPSGLKGVLAQYRANRALKGFAGTQAQSEYSEAVSGGLKLAANSAGKVLGFAGQTAGAVAAGTLTSGAAGAVGAVAGATAAIILMTIAGAIGAIGASGANGADGANGIDGADGALGRQGEPGEKGDPGEAGTSWTVSLVEPTAETKADFHLNQCTGVVSFRSDDDEWVETVDLAATQGRAVASACGLATVGRGQSLWPLVKSQCEADADRRLSNSEVARAVSQTWVANLDVMGSDPDSLDIGQPIIFRCS